MPHNIPRSFSVNPLPREPHDDEHREREEDADQDIQRHESDKTR
jgi:hypothetical protein